jgi:hypothetical protein
MKTPIKLLLTASLLSVAIASTASAATVDVYITGSSAFRASVVNAVGHLLTSPQAAFVGSTGGLVSSNQQIIVGTPNATGIADGLTSGTTYSFHTSWSGSLAGLSVMTFNSNTAAPFLPDGVTTSTMSVGTGANSNSGASGGNPLASTAANLTHGADGAFSDAYQSSTQFKSPTLVAANGGVVGVVPFVWVANPDATAFVGATGGKITNISATQAKQLLVGAMDLCQFTGNDADQGQVLPVGRNADSGTRFTTFAETGFNPVGSVQSPPQQYAVSTSGSSILVDLYPAETLFSGTAAATTFSVGQSGYASGGNEATALEINGTSGANSDNAAYLLGYVGESDAANVVKANGSYLSYNGIAYGSISGTTTSYNRTLIDEGVYTDWGYEHCYYRSGNANATPLNAVAKEVKLVDAPIAGEILSNMAVQRDYEGGPIYYVGIGGSTN